MQCFKSFLPVVASLLIGLCGAMLFTLLKAPLPWLLGSIVAIGIASRFPKIPLQSPKLFSAPARAVLGITVGSAFNPTMIHYLGDYLSSIVLIFPFVLLVTFCGMLYYWKWLKFDKMSAYFSSMPGGLLEMVTLAEATGANVYKVTMTQSVRLLCIVFTLPFMIQALSHISLDGTVSITQPFLNSDPHDMLILIVCALLGWWGALKLKIPGGTMLGPMVLGAMVYSLGIVDSRPPNEMIKLIQLILGSTVGFVFVGVTCKEITKVFVQTLGYFAILVILSALFVFGVSWLTDFPLISIILAFSPGGQSEMNLIAIIVGANLPYVALHHIVRMFLVMSVAPIFITYLRPKEKR
ncbi:AbrB family transcriptional regulator [Sulfurospirillum barnesii]|uniref:Membrane protein AbrB duplication n=1 Tax=Sulfurospirillum barnesii (strain ATCC 700032 / DSM 10660 / SES-3) TaxID=760154 RepID=I3XVE8_SULBS|nr:AbrB family transcriptional regulator [Sulfurospirillum barnesii]AFL67922.1 membrane protein AbrB duplication [Sulfurospirillum barnesii SES-3]